MNSAAEPVAADAWLTYLYDSYRNIVFRYCRRHLQSNDEADDAVQNTFLRAYTALRSGVRPENEGAWLFKIAHNVCLTRHVSEARRTRVEHGRSFDDVREFVAAPETEEREELAELDCALASMPAHLRQVILLREWQGLSYSEIAEALELSLANVETRIFRARRYLSRALRPEPESEAVTVAAA